MKKLKFIVLILPLIFFITGCSIEKENNNYEIDEEQSTPLLFEVTKDGNSNKLYLFGSIHVGDSSLYPLPNYVKKAYKESDAIAVEIDLIKFEEDFEAQMKLIQDLIATDGNTIMELLGEEEYSKLKKILEDAGLYNSLYEVYSPVMWESLLSNAQSNDAKLYSSLGIDQHILKKAKDDEKVIIELESIEFQINMLNEVDNDTMKLIFTSSIDHYDEGVKGLKELYELYKKGNRKELEKAISEEDVEGLDDYNNKILYERNIGMSEKLDKYFGEGKKVFCTVGLAHIIGEKSVIELLESKGYNVKQIKG